MDNLLPTYLNPHDIAFKLKRIKIETFAKLKRDEFNVCLHGTTEI